MPETTISKDFVSPSLCLDMLACGLTDKTPFRWKNVQNTWILWSDSFDPDNYYQIAKDWIAEYNDIQVLPAYTVAQMESIIPDYLLEKRSGQYVLSVENIYGLPSVGNTRLADAFGYLVIEILRNKQYGPVYCNDKLLQQAM